MTQRFLFSAVCICLLVPMVRAETRLTILATDPESPAILGRAQHLSLRIGCTSDQSVHIEAQGFFAGQPVLGPTGGSPLCDAQSSEVLFWLAFMDSRKVDTIAVRAIGPGNTVAAQTSLPVDLTWTGELSTNPQKPAE